MLVWLLGMLLSAAALIGMVLALLYASKNGGSVLEWMRRALAPALCPVAMAALAIDCRKLGRKTPQGKALRRVMSEIYCFASSVYAAVVSVMEFMTMLASGAMDETMELILYLLPACAILGFVVFVLRKLLEGVFRLIAGFRARWSPLQFPDLRISRLPRYTRAGKPLTESRPNTRFFPLQHTQTA